jgi:predicted CoA-binding protein
MDDAKFDPGHLVACKLRKQGIEVIAVNPKFSDDSSQRRASSLTKIEPPVEAVLVFVDRPQTMEAVDDCVAAKLYLRPVDPAHFCLKWMLRLAGKEKRARQLSG